MSDPTKDWKIVELRHKDGGKVFVRLRFVRPVGSDLFRDLVCISWEFSECHSSFDELFQSLDLFEDRLKSLHQSPESCLAFILTYSDSRAWYFYAKGADRFIHCVNELLKDYPKVPIQFHVVEDPDWSRWSRFAGR